MVQSKSRTNMFTLQMQEHHWREWLPSDMPGLGSESVLSHELPELLWNMPLLLISLWTPMYTTCHTSPSLSNVMESLGFGSKDTFKTLTAYPIAQVIIWATHNTLDHWWLNKNVRVLLIFITLYNNISAKKHNIHKQAICTCLPPALNDAIKLVLGDKYSSLLLLLLLIYLFIYLFSIPEIHQTGYRTCH